MESIQTDPKSLLAQLTEGVGASVDDLENVTFEGADPVFREPYPIGTAAAAAIAATGYAAAKIWKLRTGRSQHVTVNVRAAAAAMRSSHYLRIEPNANSVRIPQGEGSSQARGFYRTRDGRWIYIHLGSPTHQDRILSLLGVANESAAVANAILKWDAAALEEQVYAVGACAGMVRTQDEWAAHPHARAVAGAPLVDIVKIGDSEPQPLPPGDRPLARTRVLDLTWVLAGPTGTRTLAEHGADVLRIGTDRLQGLSTRHVVNTGFGKRSAVLNINDPAGRIQLMRLVSGADVFVQGYRGGSFAAHGYSAEALAKHRPGLIYVSLSAFGHLGPWRVRRGYDSIVSAVSGIAHEYALAGVPRQMRSAPLDFLSGYLLAYGVMTALMQRAQEGGSYHVRVSIARTNQWLLSLPRIPVDMADKAVEDLSAEEVAMLSMTSESPWGTLTYLAPAAQLSETPTRWDRPSVPLSYHQPVWEE